MRKWTIGLVVGVLAGAVAAVLALGVLDLGDGEGTLPDSSAEPTVAGFDPVSLYQESSGSVALVLARFTPAGGA